ncbi:hypothetical protein PFISCL1PPCAC_6072, partial [Pristionchus fissidentatus]
MKIFLSATVRARTAAGSASSVVISLRRRRTRTRLIPLWRSGSGPAPAVRSAAARRRASARSSPFVRRAGSEIVPATSSTSSAATSLFLGTIVLGNRYANLASIDELAICAILCVFGIAPAVKTDKSESSALTIVAITGNVDVSNLSILIEEAAQIIGARIVRDIIHFEGSESLNLGRRTTCHTR